MLYGYVDQAGLRLTLEDRHGHGPASARGAVEILSDLGTQIRYLRTAAREP